MDFGAARRLTETGVVASASGRMAGRLVGFMIHGGDGSMVLRDGRTADDPVLTGEIRLPPGWHLLPLELSSKFLHVTIKGELDVVLVLA